MNHISFSIVIIMSLMALVGANIAVEGHVNSDAFAIKTATFHGCGHGTQGFESSGGKCHHHTD